MKVTINQHVEYKGHNVKSGGAVTLTFLAPYDEITKSMNLLQLISEDVGIKAKMPGGSPEFVGMFMINGVNFAKDGKSTIKFTSINTAVNMEPLMNMVENGRFQVQYSGEVEIEDGNAD